MRAALAASLTVSTIGMAAAATPAAVQGQNRVENQSDVTVTAEDMLAPYYAKLAKRVSLPTARATAPLADDATISRIAFGSCNHQSRSQHMWAQIEAANPDLFLFIGDNNYGDQGWSGDATLSTLRQAYSDMAGTDEFSQFRSKVPMMVTWDDHDFGYNDGGANFAFRNWSETIFETFWSSSDEVKSRPGVYESRIIGDAGKRVQIIMLDTRYFRSDMQRAAYSSERRPLGPYVPSADSSRTVLGDVQWNWLEQELKEPVELRILVSSIQVLTQAHNYESWWLLPLERVKLLRMLEKREESGLVMLSGDRHAGGVYADRPFQEGEKFWELTSSSLNYSFSTTEQNTAREPDEKRVTDFISEENFGMVAIDWKQQNVKLELRGSKGETRASQDIQF